jgi:hypothetical protein
MSPVRNLRILLLLLSGLVLFGTSGYMMIEGWPAIDSL